MLCNFCGNKFETKYSLQTHQKRAKYCLKIQEESNSEITSELIKCEYCKKSFSPHNADRHYQNCKEKLRKRIEELEKIILVKAATVE